jgi:hypothetical protein
MYISQSSQDVDGVGIVLEFGGEHLPVVKNLIPGKAAYACGKIVIGDRLVRIGTQPTEYKSFSQVRELIVGPTGSLVTLSFCGASGEYQCENLVRGSIGMDPQSASSVASVPFENRPAPAGENSEVTSDFYPFRIDVVSDTRVWSQSPQPHDESKSHAEAASEESGETDVGPELVTDKKGRKKKKRALGTKAEDTGETKTTQVMLYILCF